MTESLEVLQSSDLKPQQAITGELFNRFIAYLDATPKTIATYTRDLKQLYIYLQENGINRPTREDIISFKDHLRDTGHKPTTIQNYITATRLFFSWTAQEGLYPNIADHLKGAKLDREHKRDYLTSFQAKAVLNNIDKGSLKGLRDYAILALMLTGGLRTIEVCRADIQDLRAVANNTALFIQGKGREEKTEYIKISPPVEKAIRAYLKARGTADQTEPLFTSTSNNSQGARLTTRSVSEIVKTAFINAGYDSPRLTAHSTRHTAVTLALLAGKSLEEVQQFARHADISTTTIYAHHLDKAKNSCGDAIAKALF